MSLIFSTSLCDRQKVAASIIETAILRKRLAHALLFSGRAAEDKWELAKGIACFANCTWASGGADKFSAGSCSVRLQGKSPEEFNKAACQSCRWITADQHPQAWLTLGTEGSRGGKIAVEKARNLSEELSKVSQYTRVIVIEDAHQDVFHRPAANALLKTIEDPKQGSVFIAFANREEDVLPTVVSRCQVVPLACVNENMSPLANFLTGKKLSIPTDDPLQKEKTDVRQYLSRHAEVKPARVAYDAIQLSQLIAELVTDDFSHQDAIDFVVALEAERLGQSITNAWSSLYLRDLLTLAEEAKLQIIHYVSPKAVLESFCLAWWQLKITGYVKAR